MRLFFLPAIILIFSFCASLLARYHWIFDLFSHFTVQYFFGGLVLGIIFLYFHSSLLALAMFFIALFSYYETRTHMTNPFQYYHPISSQEKKEQTFTVVQYNKFYLNRRFDRISTWLQNQVNTFDFIILVEVLDLDAPQLRLSLHDYYPYIEPASGDAGPNEMLVLSKHPIKSIEWRKVAPDICGTEGLRIEILPKGQSEPIIIYTVHTKVPLSARSMNIRNAELEGMAQWISQEKQSRIIFMGDWNITPYAPAFSQMLLTSKLNYQSYGILPEGTWVSFFVFPFLKIPIDHILFSHALNLKDISAGPSLGSDHHSLIATFGL